MASVVKIKRSSIQGKAPSLSSLQVGELALNVRDGKLFSANSTTVFEVGSNVESSHVGTLTVGNTSPYTFPTSDGTSGQTLVSDGNGNLTFGAGAGTFTVQDEGSSLPTSATTLNFVGSGVTVTGSGTTKTVAISGGSGGSVATSVAYSTYSYTASEGQTTFVGADDNNNNLSYDIGRVNVYLNGVRVVSGVDYEANTGATVVFTDGVSNNDLITIDSYGHTDNIQVGNNVVLATASDISASTSEITLDQFPKSEFVSAQYFVSAANSTAVHTTTINLAHVANTVYLSEFGTIISGVSMMTIDADTTADDVRLRVTPSSSGINIKSYRTSFRA